MVALKVQDLYIGMKVYANPRHYVQCPWYSVMAWNEFETEFGDWFCEVYLRSNDGHPVDIVYIHEVTPVHEPNDVLRELL